MSTKFIVVRSDHCLVTCSIMATNKQPTPQALLPRPLAEFQQFWGAKLNRGGANPSSLVSGFDVPSSPLALLGNSSIPEGSGSARSPASISVAPPPASSFHLNACVIQPLQQRLQNVAPGEMLKSAGGAFQQGIGHLQIVSAGLAAGLSREVDRLKGRASGSKGETSARNQSGSISFSSPASLSPAQQLLKEGLEKERMSDPEGAVKIFKKLSELEPSAKNTILLAKNLTDQVYLLHLSRNEWIDSSKQAIELASSVIETEPDFVEAHMVQLAKAASDDAKRAIALNPGNDLAQHLMGRWHYEMAGINPIVRSLIGMIFGATLMPGTYPEALKHYREAQRIRPGALVHTVGVAEALYKLGDVGSAVLELKASLEMDIEDINAKFKRGEAEALLQTIKKSKDGAKYWSLPAAPAAVTPPAVGTASSQGAASAAVGTASSQGAASAGVDSKLNVQGIIASVGSGMADMQESAVSKELALGLSSIQQSIAPSGIIASIGRGMADMQESAVSRELALGLSGIQQSIAPSV
eukprot:gene21566-28560_t